MAIDIINLTPGGGYTPVAPGEIPSGGVGGEFPGSPPSSVAPYPATPFGVVRYDESGKVPENAALLRTAAQGLPIPDTITVTGITEPAGSNPLVLPRIADSDGKPSWGDGLWQVYYLELMSTWAVFKNDSTYEAQKIVNSPTPIGLTGWGLLSGAGQPSIAGNADSATAIGQTLRLGAPGTCVWFRWTGTIWQFDGPAGVIQGDTPDTYFKTTVDGNGAITTTPYPVAD